MSEKNRIPPAGDGVADDESRQDHLGDEVRRYYDALSEGRVPARIRHLAEHLDVALSARGASPGRDGRDRGRRANGAVRGLPRPSCLKA